jgi:imidazole glycerol phosphate synthase subunit HisF
MIQAMLGDDRSTRDRLPGATHVSRYRVQLGEPLARLVVLEADLVLNTISRDLRWIAEKCDVVVFVCKATASMDEARAILRTLAKDGGVGPAIVTAVSHIDRVAEVTGEAGRPIGIDQIRAIKESIGTWETEFEGTSTDLVPVSTKPGHGIGVGEWLLPAIVRQLSEDKANILLRAIEMSEQTAHEK